MPLPSEHAAARFAEAYRRYHRHIPPDIQVADAEWVYVDGEPVHCTQLDQWTAELEAAYASVYDERRQTVHRLVAWCQQ